MPIDTTLIKIKRYINKNHQNTKYMIKTSST